MVKISLRMLFRLLAYNVDVANMRIVTMLMNSKLAKNDKMCKDIHLDGAGVDG